MVFKWLKRKSNSRRSSDTQGDMVTSSEFGFSSPRNSSSKSEHFEDPIRTDEYKKALDEFFARRSLGTSLPDQGTYISKTPDSKRSNIKKDERKTQSEKKPKGKSLSSKTDISQEAPEVQFLYGNQIFMPGSGMSNKKNKRDKKNKKKKSDTEGSLMSTSPDLLPPRFLRNQQIDFDVMDSVSKSPPEDFYRENSLPYIDVNNLSFNENVNNKMVKEDNPLTEIIVNNVESVKSDLSNTSFDSVARKLEKMCQFDNVPNHAYFRGVRLVKYDALKYKKNDKAIDSKNHWHHGTWMNMPVIVKENPKSWCSPGQKTSLDDFSSKDLDILTKIRHPNILLLMGLHYDKTKKIQTFYEECVGSIYEVIHEKGNILSCQTALHYLGGIANALLHLKTNNFIHTNISSHTIFITSRNVAKLCDFELCSQIIIPNLNLTKNIDKQTTINPPKIDYSSEPEYVNLKDLDGSITDDYDPELCHECVPQEITSRSLFAPFRWQAPELFDDCVGLVFPCKRTDVYSLCLVLWECCNSTIPWKMISYEQLGVIYFQLKTGIRLPKDDRYPKCVRDILECGLALNPRRRIDIEDLSEKFKQASITLDEIEEVYVSKEKPKSAMQDSFGNINKLFNESLSKSSKKLDRSESNLEYDLSNSKTESSMHLENNFYDNNETMHKTDSTEYCSLVTPTVRRFMLNSVTSGMQSKLSFDEEVFMEGHNSSAPEKIIKLNSIITPKSYKSLDIETPSSDKIDTIKSLTKSFELNRSDEKRSSYSFQVQNTSLPITPIARSTKIRRNAWLSGDENCTFEDSKSFDQIDKNASSVEVDFKLSQGESKKNKSDSIDAKICTKVVSRNKRRHSLINMKYEATSCVGTNMGAKTESLHSQLSSETSDTGLFRSRSFSLDTKSNLKLKNKKDITGVDIKPLVAIHEKWIMESKQKIARPFSFLINTVKGSLQAVKPASHHTDPLGPKHSTSQFDLDVKKGTLNLEVSSPLIRVQNSVKKNGPYKKPADFFENTLWQKEKEKCSTKSNPQGSSTPYLLKTQSLSEQSEKSTNTDTFEELCKKILDDTKYKTYVKTPKKIDIEKAPKVDHSVDFKEVKLQVLSELSNVFEKRLNKDTDDKKHDVLSVTVTLDDVKKGNILFNHNTLNDEHFDVGQSSSEDDDAVSLPDNFTQSDEVVNKALKRCQAFSALQDARSTEDMYIDDELPSHMDIQTLIENMELIPFDSHLHETLCNKGRDCCLIKIQDESQCDRLLIYCEHSQKDRTRTKSESSSTCETDSNEKSLANLRIENLPPIDLIDLNSNSSIRLQTIEERSSEEESSDSDETSKKVQGVQDLILMYENEKNNKSDCSNKKQSSKSSFILDDNTKESNTFNYFDLVDDIIHI